MSVKLAEKLDEGGGNLPLPFQYLWEVVHETHMEKTSQPIACGDYGGAVAAAADRSGFCYAG